MKKDYDTVLFKAYFYFENVPESLQTETRKTYIKSRNLCAPIFNEHICDVNKEWDLTGEPAAFGSNLEDANPEYIRFISERLQPLFDDVLKRFHAGVWITFNEYGELVGYIPEIEGSKIWVDFKPYKT